MYNIYNNSDNLQYLIKNCLSLELYNEAFDYCKTLLENNKLILNEEERNLFMKSAKMKFSFFRNGWKNLLDFEQSEAEITSIPKQIIDVHMQNLEESIRSFCMEIDYTIEQLLTNISTDDTIALIFYKKLKADYLRYYSEVASELEFTTFVENCQEIYQEAYDKCGELEPHNPLTLSVALNYSVFVYFILDDTDRAFKIADKAYKAAMARINTEHKLPEVETLIKSLEENMSIWKIELYDVN